MEPSQIENWKRISYLGSGSFGVVSLWKNEFTNEFIAVKTCKFLSDKMLTKRQKERWINEVEIMTTINHSNIIKFKELPQILLITLSKYVPTKLPLLSMEYCDKGNLRTVLKQVQNSSGLEETEIRHILIDITSAIAYLHSLNITHRDLKPENIVLTLHNNRLIYKIIDLGYAKEIDGTVSFVGTFQYLAPEIMRNQKYNNSVDYWSLGVLIFEIVTGFLPFLPQMNPFERYKYLESKQKNDIYIKQNRSGSILNYSELPKDNNISFCFKFELEVWLRRLLQFSPRERLLPFPNNLNVFEYIKVVLNKRIMTVFSVYTLEFYSYEINESTLIGTLKDWICRDIKVGKNQLVLVTNSVLLQAKDDEFVGLLVGDDSVIYVFKSGDFINNHQYDLPNFITNLFNKCTEKLKWRDLRPIYVKSLFFIKQECRLMNTLIEAFKLFTIYNKETTAKVEKKTMEISGKFVDLLGKVEEHNMKLKSMHSQDYFVNYGSFICNLKQTNVNYNKLVKRTNVFKARQDKLNNLYNQIKAVNECNPEKNFQSACALIEKSSYDSGDVPCIKMINIISQTIKEKHKLLIDKNFFSYAEATSVALKDSEIMLDWMQGFHDYIQDLCAEFEGINREKCALKQTLVNGGCSEGIIGENIQLMSSLREKIVTVLDKSDLVLKEMRRVDG